MAIKIIRINQSKTEARPSVKLLRPSPLPRWPLSHSLLHDRAPSWFERSRGGVNSCAGEAARVLALKAGNRDVSVELYVQPLMPPTGISEAELVPIMSALAENASASVEPGPSVVTLCTWWDGMRVGFDAVGHGGIIDPFVKSHLMSPGFSTRVAPWDTGFGLFDAKSRAKQIGANILVAETGKGILFRLILPISQTDHTVPNNLDDKILERSSLEETSSIDGPVTHPIIIDGMELLGHDKVPHSIEA